MLISVEQLDNRKGSVSAVGAFGFTKSWRVLAPGDQYHQGSVLRDFMSLTGIQPGYQWITGTQFTASYEKLNIYLTTLEASEGSQITLNGVLCREWIISGQFEPTDPNWIGPPEQTIPEDPSNAPVKLERGQWVERYVYPFDNGGNIYGNTAGEPFGEIPERERHYPLLRIMRRERAFDDVGMAAYCDTVNSVAWTVAGVTYPARYAKCVSINPGQMQGHQDIGLFYLVQYEFVIRPVAQWTDVTGTNYQGWDDQLANVGFNQKVSGSLVPITDNKGQYVSEPRPLTSAGAAVTYPLSSGTAMPTKGFRFFKELDFNNLGFPQGDLGWG